MGPEAKILIVEDEANIRASLEEILAQDGYRVVAVARGQSALDSLSSQTFDLALIDLKLPDMSGIEVMAGLRQAAADLVVIVLTAHASLETAVEALRQGAFDYLFKPCQPARLRDSVKKGLDQRQSQVRQRELMRQLESLTSGLEEIRATISRQDDQPVAAASLPGRGQKRFLQQGTLVMDLLHHVVTLDDHLLELTPTEFDLLAYLLGQAPRAVSPQELVRQVQGYESKQWEASDIVRSHIYHIRQKIKAATERTDVIHTVRGVGYKIE